MAKSLGSLVIDLALNTARVDRGITSTNKKLDNFGKTTRSVARIAATAFAGISFLKIGEDIVDIVDKYKLLEGRLKLVQKEGENLAATQQKLFELSNRTRQGVGETTSFYVQLARSTRDLNLAQSDLLSVTETINKAIIISGASAQSANAALFQLQQGLAAGALRGQELNSVLEQTPRVAEAIASGLGVSIGQLRKLGEQGALTAETVIAAIQKEADVLDKEFAQVPVTVAQNMQLLTNEFENAAKGAGGLNYILNKSIESLINWAKLYNQIFNPTIKQQFDEAVDSLASMRREIEGIRGEGRVIPQQLLEQVSATEELINSLNEQLIVEGKLAAIEQRREEQRKQAAKSNVIPITAAKTPKSQAQPEISTDSFYLESLRANQDTQEALLAADRDWRLRRVRQAEEEKEELLNIERNKRDSMLSSTASLFGSLASIIGSGSKKQFQISKQLARAETILNTYKGAHAAFADTPGPLPVKVAAGVAALGIGFARLAAINRTTFTSSNAAATASGAGSFVPTPSPGPITPGTNAAQGQTFIIISGGETITEQQLDDILSRASQRINEGSQVIIRRDSVQAAELASAVA